MSDLIGNPEDRFSHNEAHFYKLCSRFYVSLIHVFNPNKASGLSHPYHLDDSTLIFSSIFSFLFNFSKKKFNKYYSPRLDAMFCCISSGAIRFASVSEIGHHA